MSKQLWMAVLTSFMVNASCAAEDGNSSGTDAQSSKIPAGEAHFTPDQLEGYYRVYKSTDVKYLRTLFDEYLKGTGGKDEEFELLKRFGKDYYQSKFIVLSRDTAVFGGSLITLIFPERADQVFVAWVYPKGKDRIPELRGFDPGEFSGEDIKRMKIRYRVMFEDKVHAM